jgi:hypothetical protein
VLADRGLAPYQRAQAVRALRIRQIIEARAARKAVLDERKSVRRHQVRYDPLRPADEFQPQRPIRRFSLS